MEKKVFFLLLIIINQSSNLLCSGHGKPPAYNMTPSAPQLPFQPEETLSEEDFARFQAFLAFEKSKSGESPPAHHVHVTVQQRVAQVHKREQRSLRRDASGPVGFPKDATEDGESDDSFNPFLDDLPDSPQPVTPARRKKPARPPAPKFRTTGALTVSDPAPQAIPIPGSKKRTHRRQRSNSLPTDEEIAELQQEQRVQHELERRASLEEKERSALKMAEAHFAGLEEDDESDYDNIYEGISLTDTDGMLAAAVGLMERMRQELKDMAEEVQQRDADNSATVRAYLAQTSQSAPSGFYALIPGAKGRASRAASRDSGKLLTSVKKRSQKQIDEANAALLCTVWRLDKDLKRIIAQRQTATELDTKAKAKIPSRSVADQAGSPRGRSRSMSSPFTRRKSSKKGGDTTDA